MQDDFFSRLVEALAFRVPPPREVLEVWNDVMLTPGQVLWQQHAPSDSHGRREKRA
jgi:hypothetical protein